MDAREARVARACALRRTFWRHAAQTARNHGVSTETPALRATRRLATTSGPWVHGVPRRGCTASGTWPPRHPESRSDRSGGPGVRAPQDYLATRRADGTQPRRVDRNPCVTRSTTQHFAAPCCATRGPRAAAQHSAARRDASAAPCARPRIRAARHGVPATSLTPYGRSGCRRPALRQAPGRDILQRLRRQ